MYILFKMFSASYSHCLRHLFESEARGFLIQTGTRHLFRQYSCILCRHLIHSVTKHFVQAPYLDSIRAFHSEYFQASPRIYQDIQSRLHPYILFRQYSGILCMQAAFTIRTVPKQYPGLQYYSRIQANHFSSFQAAIRCINQAVSKRILSGYAG